MSPMSDHDLLLAVYGHCQKTDARLTSIEGRIERLEKNGRTSIPPGNKGPAMIGALIGGGIYGVIHAVQLLLGG